MRAATLLLVAALAAAGCERKPTPDDAIIPPDIQNRPAPSGETVENPTYKLWAGFPTGSSVTQRTTTENEDNTEKTVTTITYTLKERTDDHIVVESKATTVHYTDRVEENPPDQVKTLKVLPLPPGVKKEDWGKSPQGAETGEETLTVLGKEYKCSWVKTKGFTEAGDIYTQNWSSRQMPGGLVRSVSKVPAKKATITVEVTEVKIP
ncbi:MAG TPA: hypothetical protein VM529_01445 [Gemmata sp.]|nr:hypothetical protein [Gemmata sp.]